MVVTRAARAVLNCSTDLSLHVCNASKSLELQAKKLAKKIVQVLSKTWGGMNQDFAAPPGSNQDFENKLFGCPLGRSDVPLQHFFAGNSVARRRT